jgi:hypothetical protein
LVSLFFVWAEIVGTAISFTPVNFRHPFFVRMRPDKLVVKKRSTELSHAKTTSSYA